MLPAGLLPGVFIVRLLEPPVCLRRSKLCMKLTAPHLEDFLATERKTRTRSWEDRSLCGLFFCSVNSVAKTLL